MKKMKKMKKVKTTKDAVKDTPITVTLTVNGIKNEVHTNDVLQTFRDFQLQPKSLKGAMRIEASYKGGKPFGIILNIPKTRTFCVNDVTRQLLAKRFNIALGIK